MEGLRYIHQKTREKQGTSIVLLFIAIVLMLYLVFIVALEYYNVTNTYEAIVIELERAGNIAVEYTMNDEARGYHISYIDEADTKKLFNQYFSERLNLNSNLEKYIDNQRIYKVAFDKFDIDSELAQISMEGTIIIELILLKNYTDYEVKLPFSVKTRNINSHE